MSSYTPQLDMLRWAPHQDACCEYCGQLPENHHSDGCCYAAEEIGTRLSFYQRTGRWPGPDEACTPPGGQACASVVLRVQGGELTMLCQPQEERR